ncbi:transposase family protein [Arachnia propionica]|uniref:transposase family protein n=1 Tax=Arachnia propionica TaxID=1750 RepID=UPI00399D554C
MLILRHNLTQELLADIHTVSQSTISRVVAVYTPLIAEVLQAWIPELEDPRPRSARTSSTAPGTLLVMARPSRTVLRQTPCHRSEPASGLRPSRTARLNLPPAG